MFEYVIRRGRGRAASALIATLGSLALSPLAGACLNDGTAAPCRCAMRMMVTSALAKDAATASPTLSGPLATPLSADVAAAAATQTVHVGSDPSNFAQPYYYNAANITINQGDTVHWTDDSGGHYVTSDLPSTDPRFFTQFLNPGDTFDHTFTVPGVYKYHCDIHDFQNPDGTWSGAQLGSITVVATPEPAALGMIALVAGAVIRRRRR